MTDYIKRADAIEHLKNVKVSYPHADISLPIDLAIKAIEMIPSADAVDVAHDIPEYCSWSQTYTNMVQSAMSNASAEAVQGEWDSNQACSICGCQPWYEHDIHTLHFCPNCGARMKGGAE